MAELIQTIALCTPVILTGLDRMQLSDAEIHLQEFTFQLIDELFIKFPRNRILIIKRPHKMEGEFDKARLTYEFHCFNSYGYDIYAIKNTNSAKCVYSGEGGFENWHYGGTNILRDDDTGTLIFLPEPSELLIEIPIKMPVQLPVQLSIQGPIQLPNHAQTQLPVRVLIKLPVQTSSQLSLQDPSPGHNFIQLNGFFKNYRHNLILRGYPDGKVDLTTNKAGWEKWSFRNLGENRFIWKSNFGTFLSANLDGTVALAKYAKDSEIWTKVDTENGKCAWKSHHGTYLSGEPDGKVRLMNWIKGWEIWYI